jgi:SAM-dependent methyltransferase
MPELARKARSGSRGGSSHSGRALLRPSPSRGALPPWGAARRPDAGGVDRYADGLATSFVARAGVSRGGWALDAGSRSGALAAALSPVVGPERVASIARLGPAGALPFPGASFDVVLSQLAVDRFDDPFASVFEMARVARPGGVVGACVWDYAGGMRMLRTFWDTARHVDPDGAAHLDEAALMPFCRPAELRDLVEAAGLVAVRVGELQVRAGYRDFEDLWASFASGIDRSGAYCVTLDPQHRGALKAAYRRRLGAPAGPFELTARAWTALGVPEPR